MKDLIIIGAGGHGKVCAEIAKDMKKWDKISFLDDSYPDSKKCLNFDIIGKSKDYIGLEKNDFFIAIGNNEVRESLFIQLENLDINIVNLIHPTAYVSQYSTIEKGTSIHQFAVVNTDSVVGKGCIINTSSIVEHENIIKDFVHLSPGVKLGGQVVVGKLSWIGIGVTVINNVIIGRCMIIGAHSLVLSSINTLSKVYGVPLKLELKEKK